MTHTFDHHDIVISAAVIAEDDRTLGAVEEALGDYFKVRDPDNEVFWLPCDTILAVAEDAVHVSFPHDALIEHRAAAPPDGYAESHYLADDLSDQELEQRELMLRQMAQQREEIREAGLGTPEADDSVGIPVEQELEQIESGRGHESHRRHEERERRRTDRSTAP